MIVVGGTLWACGLTAVLWSFSRKNLLRTTAWSVLGIGIGAPLSMIGLVLMASAL